VATGLTVRPLAADDLAWVREVAVHHNAIARSRVLKPSIPSVGLDGIPIRHEIELHLLSDSVPADDL
jgi:hypothetical protein